MSLQVTLVGSADRTLEQLVRATGLRPTAAPASDLAALAHPGAAAPDILIVDVRPHGQVPSVLAPLKRQHPATSVMLVAPQLSPPLMLDAMRAGVSECVADPLTAESIGAAVSRIIAHRTAPVGGQVFAFVGAKGGVGTTTLAVNVAAALAKTEIGTLLIDLHPAYGDAAVLLDAEPRFSLTDALDNTHRLDLSFFTGLTTPAAGGVTLLASPDHSPAGPLDPHRVRLLLDFAARNYRYTVLDAPRSHPAIVEGLDAATTIFLVTNQELSSLRGAARVAEALTRRYGRDKVAVVVSRYDRAGEIGTDDIEELVQAPVRQTFPSDYRAALQALNHGRPLVLERGGRLAGAVAAFARDLSGETAVTAARPASPSPLLARFNALRWISS